MAFDAVFKAWLAFLASFGVDGQAALFPPASPAAIVAVEAEIGFALPDDLKALYAKGDGQKEPDNIIEHIAGRTTAPFFGGYDFVPLERALLDYRTWVEVIDEWPKDQDANAYITLRKGDPPVAREYWRKGWFPFAIDGGGNAYAVDLSPPPGGRYGQVILIGPDENQRRVLAPSLSALLAERAKRKPRVQRDKHKRGLVWFDMER